MRNDFNGFPPRLEFNPSETASSDYVVRDGPEARLSNLDLWGFLETEQIFHFGKVQWIAG